MGKIRAILRKEGVTALLLRGILFGLRASHDSLHRILARRLKHPEAEDPEKPEVVEIPAVEVIETPPQKEGRPALRFPAKTDPGISVIVLAHRRADTIYPCVRSICSTLPDAEACELILVSDRKHKDFRLIEGAQEVVCDPDETRAVNQAAALARGSLLYFVESGVSTGEGALQELIAVLDESASCGVAGSRVLLPDGRIEQAGWVLWEDGQAWAYGCRDSAAEPEYNYLREVDFCTRRSLLVRRELFERTGGYLAELSEPGYQDAHLCAAVRRMGFRVLMQPKSQVMLTVSRPEEPFPQAQCTLKNEHDRLRFRELHQDLLGSALPANVANFPSASRRLQGKRTILVIDTYVPFHDREAGSLRLFHLLRIMRVLGHRVLFLPQNEAVVEPYVTQMQNLGVEVLFPTSKQPGIERQFRERAALIDIAWVCRPELFGQYLPQVRSQPGMKIVYDTIDLHFVRLRREAKLASLRGSAVSDSWKTYRYLELAHARLADATVAASHADKSVLERYGISPVWVVPTIHPRFRGAVKPFGQREGLLFIGGYRHPPNIDAVQWLCREIMPLVWEQQPGIRVTLLGFDPPAEVTTLANDRVAVPGYVAEVDSYFETSRVFVAPVRYGAGMNGKIGQSISFGLPVVTTSIGAEGVGLADGRNVLVGDDAATFAQKILALYRDAQLWEAMSLASLDHVTQFEPEAITSVLESIIESLSQN